jgi:hypothetical protein
VTPFAGGALQRATPKGDVRMEDRSAVRLSLPRPRGPLTKWVLDDLQGRRTLPPPAPSPLGGFSSDLQLALYLAYESHFCQLPGVDPDREWAPELIAFRRTLERAFEHALARAAGRPPSGRVGTVIPQIVAAYDGPSVSRHMETHGTIAEMREFVMHRSAYQLKEGDAHTLGVPRLHGSSKQLLVEIQAGEYGADGPGREMHSTLFATTMRALGLDPRPNAYLNVLPASALMVSNLISMFGLNRRWRGALVGHLAVFEMTSVEPMGRYARGLERMGAPEEARRFYDVHVLADAEHEVMALDLAARVAADEPALAGDIIFGAQCVNVVEHLFASTLMRRWRRLSDGAHAA